MSDRTLVTVKQVMIGFEVTYNDGRYHRDGYAIPEPFKYWFGLNSPAYGGSGLTLSMGQCSRICSLYIDRSTGLITDVRIGQREGADLVIELKLGFNQIKHEDENKDYYNAAELIPSASVLEYSDLFRNIEDIIPRWRTEVIEMQVPVLSDNNFSIRE